MRKLSHLLHDTKGATAIEYGLIISLIVLGMLAGVSVLGDRAGGMWGNMSNEVVTATR
ncbi:MAG TPA: Flp family type IVb pilin [Allosphingosinicella sp.]|nr:Flp family type IVb pilin [Allosphingosinicella sp.]